MRRYLSFGLFTFVVSLVAVGLWYAGQSLPAGAQGQQATPTATQSPPGVPRTINVSGEGRVAVKPDLALLRLGAGARGATVAEAMAQTDQAIQAMVGSFRSNGIDERDIQTAYLSVSPVITGPPQPGGEPTVVGYQASQQLTVKVRDLSKLSKVLGDAAGAAGDRFQMQGVQFTLTDPTAPQSQAREQALLKAKAKAEEFAQLAGLTLGPQIAINEGAVPPSFAPVQAGGGGGGPAPAPVIGFYPGEQEFVVTVQVSYLVR